MNRTTMIISAVLATLLVAGCNTMQGFGRDVSKVGDKIEGAAKKAK